MKNLATWIGVALFVAGFSLATASAESYIWTGGISNNWNDAGNWTPGQVPGPYDTAAIPAGSHSVVIDVSTDIGGLSIGAGSSLSIASDMSLYGVLTNSGDLFWQGGDIRVNVDEYSGWSGGIINAGSGVFDIRCDQTMMNSNGTPIFQNMGILRKSQGTDITYVYLVFNTTGTVEAQSGTVQFSGGGDLGGSLQAFDNAALHLESGTFVLSGTPDFQGPGQIGVISTLVLNGAFSGTLGIYGGSLNTGSSLSVSNSGVLNILGTLGANGMYGPLINAGTVNIAGNQYLDLYGPLSNTGTVNWKDGDINVYYDPGQNWRGEITNSLGATFDISCARTLSNTGSLQFHNAGMVRKSAAAGRANISVSLNNTGTVEVQAGTLGFDAGVTQHDATTLTAGTWILSNDAQLDFSQGDDITVNNAQVTLDGAACAFTKLTSALAANQGSLTLSNGCVLSTPVALTNSGVLCLDGAATALSIAGSYTQTAGSTTLAGGATLTATAGFAITYGTLAGSGTLNGVGLATHATLGAGSHLNMNLGGTDAGTQYDQLHVIGGLTVGGNLGVNFANGFLAMVKPGDVFVIAEASGTLTGSFSNIASGARITTADGQHSFVVYYGAGSPHGAQKVVLAEYSDAIAPVLTLPADMTVEATGAYGVMAVTYAVGAIDAVDGEVAATAVPPSGDPFPLGLTTVHVSASDAAGHEATGSFTVTVVDTTGPVVAASPNVITEATGPGGAVAIFPTPGAEDLVDGMRPVVLSPPSGQVFPVGVTTVLATATDTTGNVGHASFTVTVQDTIAPVLTHPPDVVVAGSGKVGAIVDFALSAFDVVGALVTSSPRSRSAFPLGVNPVSVTAMDAANHVVHDSFTVTVVGIKSHTLTKATAGTPASLSGIMKGGPNGLVILQASSDLGQSDEWRDIGTIQLDANGDASFGPIPDPNSVGQAAVFFRTRLP